jgi:hypothetical protein
MLRLDEKTVLGTGYIFAGSFPCLFSDLTTPHESFGGARFPRTDGSGALTSESEADSNRFESADVRVIIFRTR